ncbi:MAG: pyridoxal phosphate-dependent aminotransferase [Firmicutes bacterium]|nr:pyridoxal phosphate-dependent aminotransferase [Bacillota bacterium]
MKRVAQRADAIEPSKTLTITAKAQALKEQGVSVVSFGAGEPDFNTPDFICGAAVEALGKGLTRYTDSSGTDALRRAIAEKLHRENGVVYEPNEIVVSNGAKHSLYNALMAVIDPLDEVILPAPYWLTYPELVKLCGGVSVVLQTRAEDGFKITAQQLKAAVTNKTKAIILNSPSNPTGAVYTHSELAALAKVIEEKDLYVISDEIYEKLVYDHTKHISIAAYSEKLKTNTIVVNGFSKSFAMTGWRVGYTASNAALAQAMGGIQSHTTSNANSIAQYAAAAALTNPLGEAFLCETKSLFSRRRDLMCTLLDSLKPLSYYKPQGAFYVMVNIAGFIGKVCAGKKIASAADFADALLNQQHVVVIPCESFGAPDYIRLSYATSEEQIKKGILRIQAFLDSFK